MIGHKIQIHSDKNCFLDIREYFTIVFFGPKINISSAQSILLSCMVLDSNGEASVNLKKKGRSEW